MVDPRYPEWRYLAGFATEQDAWTYVNGQGIVLSEDEQKDLREKIRRANATVSSLPDRAGIRPDVRPLPPGASDRIAKLEAEPTFKDHLQGVTSHEWGLVELSTLRCFQSNINLEYVQDLRKRAPNPGDIEGLLRFCQPLLAEREKAPLPIGFNQSTNTWTIVSENLDLRIAGNIAAEAKPDPTAPPRPFVGFVYGFGLPQLSVGEYNGALVIRNGYHRAYALLEAGHTHIPVLITHVPNYQSTGGGGPGFIPSHVVLSSRPPLLKDYFTDAAINVPRRRLRVVVSVHGEVQVIAA